MVDYTIINGSDADLSNVNAGGTDVGAFSYRDAVTLTGAEIVTLLGTPGVAVVKDLTGVAYAKQIKRAVGMAGQYLNPLA